MNNKLRVSFDSSIFCSQKYGGISRYFCEIASRLSKDPSAQVTIVAPFHINAYLNNVPKKSVIGFQLPDIGLAGGPIRTLNMLANHAILCAKTPDLIHETYYHPHGIGPRRIKRVLTIYDMIHEKFAAEFRPKDRTSQYKALAAKRADHVICISESTRRDAIEILGLPAGKTSVIHLGYDLMEGEGMSSGTPKLPIEKPFLLFVGNRGGYKNFVGLLEAIGSSPQLRSHYRLICFGGGPLCLEEIRAIDHFGLGAEQVVQLGGSDRMLATLYRKASAFVYPSRYEGFGIPPLEAMSFDCPVVCSDTSSIPEVVGDAGEYFDPYDTESMRLAIERTVSSSDLQKSLKAKGRLRLTAFSWDRCAAETLETYKKLI